MMEGINQVKVPPQLSSSLVSSLEGVAARVQGQLGSSLHTLLFLESKLLSWYSSKNAINLGPEDILFLILLCQKTKNRRQDPVGRLSMSTLSGEGRRRLSATDPEGLQEFPRSEEDDGESGLDGDWDFIDGEERLGSGSEREGESNGMESKVKISTY